MANYEELIKQADYYLEHDLTIAEASKNLGISKRTLQLHLQKLQSVAPDKYQLVMDKKETHMRQGKIKGGTLGKRGSSWTKEQAIDIAQQILANGYTYAEAGRKLNIPSSTLHDMMRNGIDDEQTSSLLYALAEAHKKGLNMEQFMETYYQDHPTLRNISETMMDDRVNNEPKK